MKRLVLDPELPYRELAAELSSVGLEEGVPASALPNLRPGEPESATWSGRGLHLRYSYNPVVGLRALAAVRDSESAGAGEAVLQDLGTRLRVMSDGRILELLHAEDRRSLILGLLAAAETRLAPALPRVIRLTRHDDPRVAGAARRSREVLAHIAGERVAEAVRSVRSERPGRSLLFELAGVAPARRQVLRHLLCDSRPAAPGLEAGLRTALEDADWEVRAGAMIGAARFGLRPLDAEVRRVALPEQAGLGLDRDDRHLLRLLRKLCVGLLEKGFKAPAAGARDAELIEHLRRLVMAERVELRGEASFDRPYLLVHALTVPVDLAAGDWQPPPLPPAIEAAEAADGTPVLRLRRSRHEVIWIPPCPAYLGGAGEHAVRKLEPRQGLFLLRDPEALGGPCPFDQARERCSRLADEEGVVAELPAGDPWERALRGPDGRLYPWGNSLPRRAGGHAETAFGLLVGVDRVGEWILGPGGEPQAGLAAKPPRVADRRPASPAGRHRVRPLVA